MGQVNCCTQKHWSEVQEKPTLTKANIRKLIEEQEEESFFRDRSTRQSTVCSMNKINQKIQEITKIGQLKTLVSSKQREDWGFSNTEILNIFLAQRKLKDRDAKAIKDSIAECINLKSLHIDFDNSQISNIQLIKIFQSLEGKKLNKLSIGLDNLELDHNSLLDLFKVLNTLGQLETFYINLNNNSLKNEEISCIANSIKKMTQIRDLTIIICRNNFNEKGAFSLWRAIQSLPLLENIQLQLIDNEISCYQIFVLISEFLQIDSFSDFKLSLENKYIKETWYALRNILDEFHIKKNSMVYELVGLGKFIADTGADKYLVKEIEGNI